MKFQMDSCVLVDDTCAKIFLDGILACNNLPILKENLVTLYIDCYTVTVKKNSSDHVLLGFKTHSEIILLTL